MYIVRFDLGNHNVSRNEDGKKTHQFHVLYGYRSNTSFNVRWFESPMAGAPKGLTETPAAAHINAETFNCGPPVSPCRTILCQQQQGQNNKQKSGNTNDR